mmetsp:Transcript_6814/g.8606  ORF Transcript_6814/g.8606 Transcript_6814/m.8606 type:complete len:371 (-) Transcript_6814:397-1509(-)
MGGDGGVVATSRKYMRGAGSACHTADSKRTSTITSEERIRESIAETMTTCAITNCKLIYKKNKNDEDDNDDYGESIVACPYGKLYSKEAAVKALLKRLEKKEDDTIHTAAGTATGTATKMELGCHVRGLKDLYPVRFQLMEKTTVSNIQNNGSSSGSSGSRREVVENVPICPITSEELNGIQPVYLIVKQKKNKQKKKHKKSSSSEEENDKLPNVISEKAIKQMGIQALQEEYGPFDKESLVRLAPPPGRILDDFKLKLEQQRTMEKQTKEVSHKKKRKKQHEHHPQIESLSSNMIKKSKSSNNEATKIISTTKKSSSISNDKRSTIENVRTNVAAAVASSAALSSLFHDDKQSTLSKKEKNDNLFSCNC